MEKGTFIMRANYRNQFARLSMEERGELITAILDYTNGLEPAFSSPLIEMAFSFIKDDLDYNSSQYAKKCRQNRENIAKRWEKEKADTDGTIVQDGESPNNENTTVYDNNRRIPNDNDSEGDNESDNESEVIYTLKPPQGDLFEQFWAAYPKKRSKGAARKAWDKLHVDSTMQATILQAIQRAKQSDDWQKDGGQYIPYPATWLNAEGWEDEEPGRDPTSDRPPVVMNWVVPNPDSDNWEDLVP